MIGVLSKGHGVGDNGTPVYSQSVTCVAGASRGTILFALSRDNMGEPSNNILSATWGGVAGVLGGEVLSRVGAVESSRTSYYTFLEGEHPAAGAQDVVITTQAASQAGFVLVQLENVEQVRPTGLALTMSGYAIETTTVQDSVVAPNDDSYVLSVVHGRRSTGPTPVCTGATYYATIDAVGAGRMLGGAADIAAAIAGLHNIQWDLPATTWQYPCHTIAAWAPLPPLPTNKFPAPLLNQ